MILAILRFLRCLLQGDDRILRDFRGHNLVKATLKGLMAYRTAWMPDQGITGNPGIYIGSSMQFCCKYM